MDETLKLLDIKGADLLFQNYPRLVHCLDPDWCIVANGHSQGYKQTLSHRSMCQRDKSTRTCSCTANSPQLQPNCSQLRGSMQVPGSNPGGRGAGKS